jgi:hypothetical protein
LSRTKWPPAPRGSQYRSTAPITRPARGRFPPHALGRTGSPSRARPSHPDTTERIRDPSTNRAWKG